MAFVGYKTTADAVKALEYFHNTFIDTSRVQVEYARAVKSAQLPRPWSKHSEGSSAHRRTHETPEERAAREAKAADAERFIGVREPKKMKRAKKDAFEKEIDDAIHRQARNDSEEDGAEADAKDGLERLDGVRKGHGHLTQGNVRERVSEHVRRTQGEQRLHHGLFHLGRLLQPANPGQGTHRAPERPLGKRHREGHGRRL